MRSPCDCVAVVLSASLLVGILPPAYAQIDHRIDNQVRGMNGRALDRNPLLGSGGVNGPASGYSFDGGFRARSLITGNMTGLASFHGQSQVLQGNGFRGGLPSAGLSGFAARSVGLGQVRSRRALAPTSYLGTQETIPDLGFIRRGLNRPGASLLISPLTRRPRSTVQEARSKLLDIRLPSATRVGVQPDLSTYGTRQRPLVSGGIPAGREASQAADAAQYGGRTLLRPGTYGGLDAASGGLSPASSPFGLAADSSIFGSPGPGSFRSPAVREGNTSESRRSIDAAMLSRRLDRPIDGRKTLSGEGETGRELGHRAASGEPHRPGDRFNDPRTVGVGAEQHPGDKRDARADELAVFTAGGKRSLSATKGIVTGFDRGTPGGAAARPANLGADRFADFASAVQAAQAGGASRLGFLAGSGIADAEAAAPGSPTAAFDPNAAAGIGAQASAEPPTRPRGESVRQSATAVQWAGELLDDPIKSFVGRYRSQLNTYMKQAEDALHGGKFYDAARLFDLAHTVEPANPLPLLGRGHALVAAGDYLSGEIALERGLNRFPQIVAFRLDLPSLVGRQDTYDLRRLDLEKRLDTREHYKLRFVLGYLELYSGLQAQGLRNLRRAAERAPAESIIAIFPDLLLGRQALPPVGRRHR